ncbi:SRPBCC family protein [Tepidamorphus sp. 3E244]|uniref:SRPBCC family protein n=1 Tax=Tepidamorphus sp. 3E244 TaxID=3385498 RepID=UPI0038FC5CA2
MTTPTHEYELSIDRVLDARRENVWRCWTEPELLKRWFTPKPYETPSAELDVRPGGKILITMRSPEGEEFPNPGVYLEVVENEKLVMTDAYTQAWKPSGKAFMTTIIELEDAGEGKTRYLARALHWSAEDHESHEKMGFEEGWGKATDQLEELAKSLEV